MTTETATSATHFCSSRHQNRNKATGEPKKKIETYKGQQKQLAKDLKREKANILFNNIDFIHFDTAMYSKSNAFLKWGNR